jgi:hypothetical protein
MGCIRRPGAGRKPITVTDPQLVERLEAMIDSQTPGDPESPLRWICKSTRAIAQALTRRRHPVSHAKLAQILHDLSYRLQSNRKTEEGQDHPDRDAQFRYISREVQRWLAQGRPLISVDTKKKELLGNYANGQQWLPAKQPRKVRSRLSHARGPRAYLYGLRCWSATPGLSNIGTDHDTGAFAVASIRGWWRQEGKRLYPRTGGILITADGGGSNEWRLRLWKVELQKLADETGLYFSVCHFPPGTSQWNKVEHRLFSFISSNWRGEPLRNYETVVHLIAKTTTAKGLKVTCRSDRRKYPTGHKVTPQEMKRINLQRHKLHGEWNYVIRPHSNRRRRQSWYPYLFTLSNAN